MNSELARYVELKERVEKAQTKADKAEGALGEIKARLKKEFDCGSLKEAKTKLKALEQKRDKTEKTFNESLSKFEGKWNENLD